MTKKKMLKAISFLGLSVILLIGFIACDTGNGNKLNGESSLEAKGTKDKPIKVEYKNLKTYLKNTAGSDGTNFIEVSNISNEDLKGSGNSCSELGALISNGNKKVYLILGKKTSRAVINFSEIGDNAFYGVKNLVGIEFSAELTNIGKNAFKECSDLVTVDFSGCNNLETISEFAFEFCYALKNINFSECTSLKIIERFAFSGCDLKSLDFSACTSLTTLKRCAFSRCESLEEVIFPIKLEKIDGSIFYGCNALKTITVDKNNTNYSSKNGILFNKEQTKIFRYPNGKKDENYEIPTTVNEIGDNAFSSCKFLNKINFHKNIKIIGSFAFEGCSLKNIDLSMCKSLTYIGWGAFHNDALTNINIGDNGSEYSSIAGVLFNKNKTELIQYPVGKSEKIYNIPESVTNINIHAFSSCKTLEKITFPTTLIRIKSQAFRGCTGLIDIDLSNCNDLKKIESQAFESCINATIKLANSDIDISEAAIFGREDNSSFVKEVQIPKNNTYDLKQRIIDSGYPKNKIKEY